MEDEVLIDRLVAKRLGGDSFIIEMMEAVRNGHLCVRGDFEGENVEKLRGDEEWFDKPIGRWGDLVYFQRCWVLETRVVKELKRLMVDVKQIDMEEVEHLNSAQVEALRKGLARSIFCLSGGPGTGKTHTIVELVKQFQRAGGSVVVAAPTGKAVAGLRSRLPDVECGTLHGLLGVKSVVDVLYERRKLDAAMIVVDECSMIDVGMWGALLGSISTGTRLVLVGDHDQLPPVEAGTIYGEICGWMRERHSMGYAHLSQCMRSDQAEILELAEKVKQGEVIKGKKLGRRLDLRKWKGMFVGPVERDVNVQEMLGALKKFRILSCLRQGPFGVEALNREMVELFRRDFRKGNIWPIPIIATRTSYRLRVCNGEMGILLKHSASLELEKDDVIYFEDRSVPAVLLPGFEWAYAISVHKSQGSEYDRVVLIAPPGMEIFGREILYTGITRARSSLEVYGSAESLTLCASVTAQKLSGIRKKLQC